MPFTQSVRHHLRQWRLSGRDGVVPADRRLGRISRRARRSRAGAAAARHRARQLCRDHHRRAARARRDHGAARGQGRDRHRHHVERPGPRDELRPAGERMARRALRDASSSSPATPTACRWAAARTPAARCAMPASSWARRPTTSSPRAAASPRTRSRPTPPISNSGRPLPHRRHRPRARHLRGARRSRPRDTCPRSCAGRWPRRMTRCSASRAFPTARRSARSRSIPRPALWRSCAMPRSTMSAAPSTR